MFNCDKLAFYMDNLHCTAFQLIDLGDGTGNYYNYLYNLLYIENIKYFLIT